MLDHMNNIFQNTVFQISVDVPFRLKICAITAGIKKFKSIIKKKNKKHEKIVMLEKILSKSSFIKLLGDSYITHKKFVSISNVLKEYNKKKEEINNSKTSVEYII